MISGSHMPRNQIASISGLTNTYIRDVENGKVVNLPRDRIILLALALNLDLFEMDKFLGVFDRTNLTSDDIPIFFRATEKMRISGALTPIRNRLTFELATLAARRQEQKSIAVLQTIAATFRDKGHTSLISRTSDKTHPIYHQIVEALDFEKKQNLRRILIKSEVVHYVCKYCLERYFQAQLSAQEMAFRKLHMQNTVEFIESYDTYHLRLTDICPTFQFGLKTLAGSGKNNEVLWFIPGSSPPLSSHPRGKLIGFVTDNQSTILSFKDELSHLRLHINNDYTDRGRLIDYLQSLIKS